MKELLHSNIKMILCWFSGIYEMMMRYGFPTPLDRIIKIMLNIRVCCNMVCDAGLCENDAIIDVHIFKFNIYNCT